MNVGRIIKELKKHSVAKNKEGMALFGIKVGNALGVPIPAIRDIAKQAGKDHALALELWKTGVHEARILAGFVDVPALVSEKQMEDWVSGFDSWDLCDQVCMSLFDKTPFAYKKAIDWSKRKEEYVKRAGFAIMASLAVHDKKAKDADFMQFFERIKAESGDERNFVKKAVNWALRQIGKRNKELCRIAIKAAKEIKRQDTKAAVWIASDALRELERYK